MYKVFDTISFRSFISSDSVLNANLIQYDVVILRSVINAMETLTTLKRWSLYHTWKSIKDESKLNSSIIDYSDKILKGANLRLQITI